MELPEVQSQFGALDWGIFAVYTAFIVVVGLWVNRYISNMADYVVAGRALGKYISIAAMIGSELGLVTVMYSAQKGFTGGFAAFHIAVIAAVVTLIVGLSGFIVVPLRSMGVMTIPEFYERRFSRGVRIYGGFILALSGILNMGLFLKAGALFVAGLTGLTNPDHVNLLMTFMLLIVLVYTVAGGMVSVVITDYLQFVLISIGFLITGAIAINKLGWTNIVQTVIDVKGEAGFNPFDESGFGFNYVVWMFFMGIVGCAVWQTAVMRALSAKDVHVVKRLYAWSSIGFLIRFLIPYFFGICALVYFAGDASLAPVFVPEDGQPDAQTSLLALPIFLSQILPTGVIGIVGAGMLAGFMSTHDSYLLCWSSVIVQDVIAPLTGDRLKTSTRLLLSRVCIVVIGCFLLFWGLWYPLGQDLWDYMAITGAVYFCGAFALLITGLYWNRGSRVGAYAALTCGFLSVLGLTPLKTALGIDWSGAVIGLFTITVCIVVMVLGSLLFPDRVQPNEAEA